MAEIMNHQLDFGLHSQSHPALSFGFGLSSSSSLPPPHLAVAPANSTSPIRSTKRRLEDDDDDERMGSPAPEARRKVPLKRNRLSPSETSSRDVNLQPGKGRQPKQDASDTDVQDIGVMLGIHIRCYTFSPMLILPHSYATAAITSSSPSVPCQ